jgi:hypothetical protein
MSSDSSVSSALADYAAGRLTAQQLVGVVTTAYYGARGLGARERLQPLIEIIERAHPGVVELFGNGEKPGYAIRLAERPFPKRHEAALREAVQNIVRAPHAAPNPEPRAPSPSFIARIFRAIRNVFTA